MLVSFLPLHALLDFEDSYIDKIIDVYLTPIRLVNTEKYKETSRFCRISNSLHFKIDFKTAVLKNPFILSDVIIFFKKYLKVYLTSDPYENNRLPYKLNKIKQSFYFEYNSTKISYFYRTFNHGWSYIWGGLRFWVLPICLSIFIFYYLCILRSVPFNKSVFGWLSLIMLFYWLISGFVFFIKKYQFGKYTSVIQRFWRRSYIIFWILESCLFLVFVYLCFNASSESFFVVDEVQIFKSRLYSWRFFIFKLLPLSFLILIGYTYLLQLKHSVSSKTTLMTITITFVLTYVVWLEFYQFYHVVNYYGNFIWIFEPEDKSWNLELEPRRNRIVNNYITILVILKFWHVIFIYLFWLFFVLRVNELSRVRYPLLSANLQNFIILYIFAWVLMFPWFKFYFRKIVDNPYYWFYGNTHFNGLRIFFGDLKLILYSDHYTFYSKSLFWNYSFFYWQSYSADFHFDGYKKHFIRNTVISSLI